MTKFRNKSGFTIMEVLLALVISCIVMVASVPIITLKKSQGNVEKWTFADNNTDISYGTPSDNMSVGIGTSNPRVRLHIKGYEKETGSGVSPAFTLRSPNNVTTIMFADRNLDEIGRLAIQSSNTSSTHDKGENIALGKGAMNRLGMKLAGYNTLYPARNIAIGVNAMKDVGYPEYTVVIGINSCNLLNDNTQIAIGNNILKDYKYDMSRSVLIGNYTDSDQLSGGSKNVIVGHLAGRKTRGANGRNFNNILLGNRAGYSADTFQTEKNIFIGNRAGEGVIDSERIIIGSTADSNNTKSYVSSVNIQNVTPYTPEGLVTVIGKYLNAALTPKNTIVGGVIDIGTDAAGTTYTDIKYADVMANNIRTDVGGANLNSYVSSDKRLKNITGDYKSSLSDLKKINVYTYTYKFDGDKGTENAGVIAQELKDILPDAVMQNNRGIYMVNYDYVNMTTLNSLKDLQQRNKELKNRIEKLKKLVNEAENCKCQ